MIIDSMKIIEEFEKVSLEDWLLLPRAESHYLSDLDGNIIYLGKRKVAAIAHCKLDLFFNDVGELLKKIKQGAREEDERSG